MKDINRADMEGRGNGMELGGVEGGKTITRIYFVRKNYILNRNVNTKSFNKIGKLYPLEVKY